MNTQTIILAVFACALAGCQSRPRPDAWQLFPSPKGGVLHNQEWQQTVFDTNDDGRVDRLRFWIGSGLAEEMIDEDFDGWFDSYLRLSYERPGAKIKIHEKAPSMPTVNSSGAFERPNFKEEK